MGDSVKRHALLLFAGLLLAASPARAMVMEAFGDQAVLSGEVFDGDYTKLQNLLREHKSITTIILRNSPGGMADEGGQISTLLRSLNVITVLDGYCASACADMFLSGTERRFLADSNPFNTFLGFHGTYVGRAQSSWGSVDWGRAYETQQWIGARTEGKVDKKLVERWTTLRDPNGLIYFFDSERAKMKDGASILLCQGTEKSLPADCEHILDHDIYNQGLATSKTRVKPNAGAEAKAPAK